MSAAKKPTPAQIRVLRRMMTRGTTALTGASYATFFVLKRQGWIERAAADWRVSDAGRRAAE